MMNSLLTKFYNKYAIIYVQCSPKKIYIEYYNIICESHEQLTSHQSIYIYIYIYNKELMPKCMSSYHVEL